MSTSTLPETAPSHGSAADVSPATPPVRESSPAQIGSVVVGAVTDVQRRLPESNLPVFVCTGILMAIGVVEWPVAIGLASVYLAFKWWPVRS